MVYCHYQTPSIIVAEGMLLLLLLNPGNKRTELGDTYVQLLSKVLSSIRCDELGE